MTPGTLFLVPAPLDFGCDTQAPLSDVLPDHTLRTAARLTDWICGGGGKMMEGVRTRRAKHGPRCYDPHRTADHAHFGRAVGMRR